MNELRQRAASHTMDIIAVSETWASDELSDAELAIDGFVLFRKDRKTHRFSKGGGVVIYIRDTLKACLSPSLNNSTFANRPVGTSSGNQLFHLCSLFTARCTVRERGIALVGRPSVLCPSVCPSVTLMYRGYISCLSSKVLTRIYKKTASNLFNVV